MQQRPSLASLYSSRAPNIDDLLASLDDLPEPQLHTAERQSVATRTEEVRDPKIALTYKNISTAEDITCGEFSTFNDNLTDSDGPTSGYIDFN